METTEVILSTNFQEKRKSLEIFLWKSEYKCLGFNLTLPQKIKEVVYINAVFNGSKIRLSTFYK